MYNNQKHPRREGPNVDKSKTIQNQKPPKKKKNFKIKRQPKETDCKNPKILKL